MRKTLILLLSLTVLAGAGYLHGGPALAWLGWSGAEVSGPRLRVAALDRGAITAVVTATGTVNPVVSVIVGSQLSGQVREVRGEFNQRVAAGQLLARLDTQQLEATRAAAAAEQQSAQAAVAVAQASAQRADAEALRAAAQLEGARANILRVEAQARDAEFEATRTDQLRRSGVGPVRDATRAGFTVEGARAQLDATRAEAAQAEAQLAAFEASARTAHAQVRAAQATAAQRAAQLRQVDVNLSFAVIRSPIDGIIVSRSVDLGQTVAASLQAPTLFTIAANLDEMEVWATVDEADIGRIRAGQPVTFTVAAHPQVNLRGVVKEIRLSPTTVNNVVTYTVVVTAANPEGRMLPGMTATLRIMTDERADVLRVPNAALRWRPPGTAAAPAAAASPMEAALRDMEDLTPAQRQEIEAAQQEFRAAMAAMAALPSDAEARRRGAQTARQRLQTRLTGSLTTDQRARLASSRGQRGAMGTVHVQEGGVVRAVRVRTGLTDGQVTEIADGPLTEGQALVVGTERAGARPAAAPARPLF